MRECTPALSLERRRDRSPPGPFRHRWSSIPRADRDLRARGMGACRSDLQDYSCTTYRQTKPPHRTAPHPTEKGGTSRGLVAQQLAQLVAHGTYPDTVRFCVGSMDRSPECIGRENPHHHITWLCKGLWAGPSQWAPCIGSRGWFRPGRSIAPKKGKESKG